MVDAANVEDCLVWSRECVGHQIGFAGHVADISGKLCDARELVGLSQCLRIRLFVYGRNQTLMVCIQRKGTTFYP